jgi:hypothetical protein
MSQDRRTFLKTAGAAASVAAAGACAPVPDAYEAPPMDGTLLRFVGEVVLPSELGEAGREGAVQSFERWAAEYEAVPELNHGYGTSQIRYGPPDPVPAWGAQLRALELEGIKRHGVGLLGLDPSLRETLVRRHIVDEGPGVPSPLQARHVAVALLSHWLSTPEATDRCYGVRISPRTCRGIESAPQEPEDLA